MQSLLKEEWRDVVNYEAFYEVSSLGNVRRKLSSQYQLSNGKQNLKSFNLKGHKAVDLCVSNTRKRFTVHQLVAVAFNIIPSYGCIVNHIDGNKANNCVSNLEHSSYSANNTHAYQTGLKPVNGKTTTYKGVYKTVSVHKRKDGTEWRKYYYVARITINGKKIYIRQFTTELEAALAYDKYIDDHNITTHTKNFA